MPSCQQCGKDLGPESQRFCSHNCYWDSMGRKPLRTCAICSRTFRASRSRVERGRARFCSTKCMGIFQKTLKGPLGRNWKGGRSSRAALTIRERIRHTMVAGNGGSFTLEEWEDLKNRTGRKCVCCGTPESIRPLTIDHVVSVINGGTSYIDNIQPLCLPCNSRKNCRNILYELPYVIHINDLAAIPLEYMKINHSKIQKAIDLANGKIEIPGIETYSEEDIAGRAK